LIFRECGLRAGHVSGGKSWFNHVRAAAWAGQAEKEARAMVFIFIFGYFNNYAIHTSSCLHSIMNQWLMADFQPFDGS
jgi:hypothetical protein